MNDTHQDNASPSPERASSVDEQGRFQRLRDVLEQRLVGQEVLIERLLIALLTGGHVLIQGPPGVAKTRTVKEFSELLALTFTRIQATPDLLPADLTGTDIFHPPSGEFRFTPGPLFANVVLFDEVNRAPPKVQSALLECMGELQITNSGQTRHLTPPFLVAATQNPIDHEGTYPLPEAQLDRFMFQVDIDWPDAMHERAILDQNLAETLALASPKGMDDPAENRALADAETLRLASEAAHRVHVSDAIREFIVALTMASRGEGPAGRLAEHVIQAASPRASIFLGQAGRARAWLHGRDHVLPDDIEALAADVFAHRIELDYQSRADGISARQIIADLLDATPRV